MKMQNHWLSHLKRGLSRRLAPDRITGKEGYSNLRVNLQNLRPFVHRHWRKGLLGSILILFVSLLSFLPPLITRYLIDKVILDHKLELLAGAIILFITIALAEKLMSLLQQFYFSRFEQEVVLDIQQNLLERAFRFPKSFFDDQQTGYLMARLSSDVQGLRWFFSSTIAYILSNILRFAGGIGFLFYLEWRLAVLVLILLPGLILVVRYFSGKIHILSYHGMEQNANISSRLQEALSSFSLIKAFSSEMRILGRLTSELKAAMQNSLEQSTVNSVADLVINSMPGIARAVVLALGAYWVITNQWTLGSLLAFQAYLGYVFGPAQFLASANMQLQTARAALERVSALFNIIPEENLKTGKKVERLKGEVEFRNVSFAYDGKETVLENISWHIHSGGHIAIVGPSGVGKTTLVSLILRFYKPTAGEIYFDGLPAAEYELQSLRNRMGYVAQNTILLAGTIKENLRYGNPEATEMQVHQAAQAAGIHAFICSLPQGYQSAIGERGVNLSEGQKQRISIARALIRDPDILILDEPTSALDSLTEKSIFQSLPTLLKRKTLFVVAHRLSTIKDCDRIFLLNEKQLVAMGSHEALWKGNDYYRSLVSYQQTPMPA